MTIIRVDPSLLQGLASTIGGAAGDVSGLGGDAAQAAASAPSYDGQFGPKVWPIGGEAISRVRGAASHLSSLSERLGQKAAAFAEADAAAIDGLAWVYKNWLDEQAQMAARWSKLTGIPAPLIERYLTMGALGGGTPFVGLLFGMVMVPGMFSWTGQTFGGIQKPSWWPSWLWLTGSAKPSVATVPAPAKTKTKSPFGDLLQPRDFSNFAQQVPAFDGRRNFNYYRSDGKTNSDCTWYAAAAVEKAHGIPLNDNGKVPSLGNAGDWGKNAHAAIDLNNPDHQKYQKLEPYISAVNSHPEPGSIYVMPPQKGFESGHVMFVEQVKAIDLGGKKTWELVVSEENWGGQDNIVGAKVQAAIPNVERWTRTFTVAAANNGGISGSGEFIHFVNKVGK
jgi:surface antigen